MSSETVVGVLTRISAPIDGIEYFFETESGEFLRIKGKPNNVPLNAKVALCLHKIGIGLYEVCNQDVPYTMLRENQ